MINIQDNLDNLLQGMKKLFGDKYISSYIFNNDGLPISNCSNADLKIAPETIGPTGSSLLFALEQFNAEMSNGSYNTTVIQNHDYIYILSGVENIGFIILILRNEGNVIFLDKMKKIGNQIKEMMVNITSNQEINMQDFSNIEDFFNTGSKTDINLSEDTIIKHCISLINSIMTQSSHNTNYLKHLLVKAELIKKNNLKDNLNLLLNGLKKLKYNFRMELM
jgi:predicted regulator of Ras-like GTPase activity (Roadblock/LC7/MglB family)